MIKVNDTTYINEDMIVSFTIKPVEDDGGRFRLHMSNGQTVMVDLPYLENFKDVLKDKGTDI